MNASWPETFLECQERFHLGIIENCAEQVKDHRQ